MRAASAGDLRQVLGTPTSRRQFNGDGLVPVLDETLAIGRVHRLHPRTGGAE